MADTPTDEQVPDNSPQTLLEKAEAVARKIEEGNKKTEELLKRQEEIEAKKILAGRSEVGAAPVQKSPQEKVKEGAMEMFKGTEIEKAIKKHG